MSPAPADPRPAGPEPRACVVTLAGQRFAVEVRHAREVVVFDDYTVVPLAPPQLVGVANLRGAVMPLVDVRPFLGLPPARAARQARALVVERDGEQAALMIDDVLGLEPLEPLIAPPADETAGSPAGGGGVTVLDVGRILAELGGDTQPPEEGA